MITPTHKGSSMTAMSTTSRGPARWLTALCAPLAVVLVVPTAGFASDTGASTIRASLGADGAVKTVKAYGVDGKAGAFDGKLPVTLGVTRSVSGGSTVLAYHVENVASETQDVTYTDTAGKTHTSPVELQLPLVAQLGVTLPASMKEVSAPGATITTDPNGVRHVLWQMVLFTPLGSASQDVSLTASGSGTPSAQLRATPVDPATAPGVSSAAAAANQSITQDDFWQGYAHGGDEGLTKLRAGMGQLVSGLQLLAPGATKLASGLGAAGDGATKLADGTDKAKDGAGQLSTGLVKIQKGQSDLTGGLKLIHDGLVSLTGGLTQLHDGAGALSTGVTAINTGAGQLSTGLGSASTGGTQLLAGSQALATGAGQASAGAGQLAAGLPALVDGLKKVDAGLAQLGGAVPAGVAGGVAQIKAAITTYAVGAYIGSPGADTTLLGGLALVHGGLTHSATGPADPGGIKEVLTRVVGGLDAAPSAAHPLGGAKQTITTLQTLLGCTAVVCTGVVPAATPYGPRENVVAAALQGLLDGLGDGSVTGDTALFALTRVLAGIGSDGSSGTLLNGVTKLQLGLDHPSAKDASGNVILKSDGTPLDPGGLKQFLLEQINGGLDKIVAGVSAGVSSGVGSPTDAATASLRGAIAALTAGATAASGGATALADGTAKVAAGAGQLSTTGAAPLAAGLLQLYAGAQQLADGSGKAAVGAAALAVGAGKALDGSKQLTAGSASALAGSTQLRDGAGQAVKGSQALLEGLGQLSAGQHQVADGLPAAIDGAAQIADGLAQVLSGGTQVRDGLGQVQDGAVGPLNKQTGEAAQNARKQVAILAAAGAMTAKAPGGAGASYVLDQAVFNPKLAAATSNSNSDTGRNVGIGVGGALLLLVGAAAGFASGRRRRVVAP